MNVKQIFLLLSLLLCFCEASEISSDDDDEVVVKFFNYDGFESSPTAATPLLPERFMNFFGAHVQTSFKNSEHPPTFRKSLNFIYENAEEHHDFINYLSCEYKELGQFDTSKRWSLAVERVLSNLARFNAEICENVMNNIFIPNHPLKEYFDPFTVGDIEKYGNIELYFENVEIQIFINVMPILLEANDTKFTENHINILTFFYKYVESVSWRNPISSYHFTFMIRCIINAPFVSYSSLKKQLNLVELPTVEDVASDLFNDINLNSHEEAVKTVKQFTRENGVDQSNYLDFIGSVMENDDDNFELISPEFLLEFLDKMISKPSEEIKEMDSSFISVIKNHIMKVKEGPNLLNQTCFWIFYAKYANWALLDEKESKWFWISSIYSLVYEVSKLENFEDDFDDDFLTVLSSFSNELKPNLQFLTEVVSYGHIPTANLSISKLKSQITLEMADKLLFKALENNYNDIGEFLVKESGLIFSYTALQRALEMAHTNRFGRKLEELLQIKIDLIGKPASSPTKIAEFESNLKAAIKKSCLNRDDQSILNLIQNTDIEQVRSKIAEDALMELARSGRVNSVRTISVYWISNISSDFRKSLLPIAAKQFSNQIFEALIKIKEFTPEVIEIESILMNFIANRCDEMLELILEHWDGLVSQTAANEALLKTVSSNLCDKLDILLNSDLRISEKTAFDALLMSIEMKHFDIFEYFLSEYCPIEFSEDDMTYAKIFAQEKDYIPSKRRRFK